MPPALVSRRGGDASGLSRKWREKTIKSSPLWHFDLLPSFPVVTYIRHFSPPLSHGALSIIPLFPHISAGRQRRSTVARDRVLGGEDASFLTTRFHARHDYTEPPQAPPPLFLSVIDIDGKYLIVPTGQNPTPTPPPSPMRQQCKPSSPTKERAQTRTPLGSGVEHGLSPSSFTPPSLFIPPRASWPTRSS